MDCASSVERVRRRVEFRTVSKRKANLQLGHSRVSTIEKSPLPLLREKNFFLLCSHLYVSLFLFFSSSRHLNFRRRMRIRETEVRTDDLYKLICNLSIPSRRDRGGFPRWLRETARRGTTTEPVAGASSEAGYMVPRGCLLR